ncbi:MAG: hypothetical protein M8357_10275 [Desulfobulbaceae bacterium]|nr:hypothetical protein [Desulfobulbaceae bacterium]
MPVIADTHVHIYPFYNLRLALDTLRNNLSALAPDASCMAFLAERHDCRFFKDFSLNAPEMLGPRVEVDVMDTVLRLREPGFRDLYIVAGRQIITIERIEILALMSDTIIDDNQPARQIVEQVRNNGGMPVLSWAPGKWFFERKQVVATLLKENKPGTLLLGDTTLRPLGWTMPVLMKQAVQQGFLLAAGSDPLPFSGEEAMMGRYAIRLETDLDHHAPLASIRNLFATAGLRPTLVGNRGNLLRTMLRLYKNAGSKKR